MKRLVIAALLSSAVFGSETVAQQTAGTTKFSVAGIPVIFKPVRANDVVAVRLYLRGGSGNLTPATAGIEALMLEAAQQGTAKYEKDALNERLVETGTTISGEAGYDYSVLALRGVRQHWNEAWDLFSQVALNPTFPESEVELVRARMLDQVKRIPDDPDSYLSYLADSSFYAGHAYAVPPGGTPQSIAGIQRAALGDWHRRRFTKENLLVVVVGNVSRADVAAKVAATFGKLPATGGRAVRPAALRPVTRDVLLLKRELPTNYITGYFSAPAPGHADYAALRVATDILSNRLFEEVRTKRNLTYAVGAGLGNRATNRGSLYVTAVAPDTTLKVIFSEVRRLQSEPLSRSRLAENVNTFITRFWLGQQSSMGQAAQLGAFELVGGGWQNVYRFVDAVRRVTPADVQRVAGKYMQRARFAVIGDPTKVDRALITSF
jgi:zinc protease